MIGGFPAGAAAVRMLRLCLPLCLVAATAVAVSGLFGVVSEPLGPPVSRQSPSLRLGAVAEAKVPETPAPATSKRPTLRASKLTQAVAVVNASGVNGLATRTASVLRRRGVTIASVENLVGVTRPAAGTVYYPPGTRSQAQLLATLAGASSVVPAPRGLRADGTLVLVVTASSRQPTS